MEIKVIGSGSSGNAYWVRSGSQSILLDCGLPIKKIQVGLNFQCSSLDGCLITHSHGDHIKAAKDLLKLGIDLYAGRETFEAAGLQGHRAHVLQDRNIATIGSLEVMPLAVKHDVPTFSYFVRNCNEKLLYITDAEYFPYKVKGITHLMIEANHDTDVIEENVKKGQLNEQLAKRIIRSHMSIRSCLTYIEKMDRSRLEEIWLLHLSSDNSRAEDFLYRVRAMTGCVVHMA